MKREEEEEKRKGKRKKRQKKQKNYTCAIHMRNIFVEVPTRLTRQHDFLERSWIK